MLESHVTYVLNSPLQVQIAKTKKASIQKFRLNWNFYRAAHFRTITNGKVIYKSVMTDQINALPEMNKIFCVYTAYQPTRRKYDVANVCSVHEKFFMDALVQLKKLPDDNTDYCIGSLYLPGGLDKENPRVKIEIISLN